MFDKVILLYEGREIFFGPAAEAKSYFTKMGFICSERTTTGDFLTSLTNPIARSAVVGSQAWSLRSAEDFAEVWKLSSEIHLLIQYIDAYNNTFPLHSKHLEEFRAHRMAQKASHTYAYPPVSLYFSPWHLN
jgi:ATP-binding cassette subfamily G (WHITE) protein 2 (PDR)